MRHGQRLSRASCLARRHLHYHSLERGVVDKCRIGRLRDHQRYLQTSSVTRTQSRAYVGPTLPVRHADSTQSTQEIRRGYSSGSQSSHQAGTAELPRAGEARFGQVQASHSPQAAAPSASTYGYHCASRNVHGSSLSLKSARRILRAYAALSKANLSALVVASSAFGFVMAGPAGSGASLVAVSLGTALCSASASALNQMYEIENDGRMARTRARPLPSGRLSMQQAGVFAAVTGAAGGTVLLMGCNPVAAALGVGNIALYAAVYTPMKQASPFNTVVGSVVGAIPPLMGWAAAGGALTDPAAAALFGVLFLWQMPHFYALAWRFRQDYENGGYQMISRGDSSGGKTASRILGYSGLLSALPLVTTWAGVTGAMFAIEGAALGALLMPLAFRFWRDRSDESARKVFLLSLWYLPLFMVLMGFHSTAWKEQEKEQEQEQGLAAGRQVQYQGEDASETDMYFRRDVWGSFLASVERQLRGMPEATAAVRRQLSQACPHELLKPSMRAAIEQQRQAAERPLDAETGALVEADMQVDLALEAALAQDRGSGGGAGIGGSSDGAVVRGEGEGEGEGPMQRIVAAAATAACPVSVERDSARSVAEAAARASGLSPAEESGRGRS